MDTTATNGNSTAIAFETHLQDWIKLEKAAVELITHMSNLWYDNSVELLMFRNQMVDRSVSEVINLHHYAKVFVKQPITVYDTLEVAAEMAKLDLAPSRIDIGKLTSQWLQERSNGRTMVKDFVTDKLKSFIGKDKRVMTPKDVVLYGFGRIGRILARELIVQAGKGEQLRLRAIVTRDKTDEDIIKRADLLRSDSVHGPFPGTVIEDLPNKTLNINGHVVHMISAKQPEEIDYTAYGINDALLIDNTGILRNRADLGRHLTCKGIGKVMLTAPAQGDIPNVVYGVNQAMCADEENIFSAASCTTNAIVPVLAVMDKVMGIEKGHIETIHSYTNDQNLLDNYHKKYRRGRSAPLNMVITETGADKAVSKALPHLAGKITGNAVRVPTPNVSLAILNLSLNKNTSKEEINDALLEAALQGELVEQIQYSQNNELVSSDLVGCPASSIVDSPATIVSKDGKSVVLYVWYDNEYGYSRQCIRFAKYIAKVIRLTYY